MKNAKQRGYIDFNFGPLIFFAVVGLIGTIWGAIWLARFLFQHLHWITP